MATSSAVKRGKNSTKCNIAKDCMHSFSFETKIKRGQICYGMEITLCSPLNDHFLGHAYGLQALSERPSKQTRFVLKNALHKKDYGPVRYGDMVFLEAGESHIVGTSEADNEEISNLILIETYLKVCGKYTPPDIINNYGLWKSHNENIWKFMSFSGDEGDAAISTDKVFSIAPLSLSK